MRKVILTITLLVVFTSCTEQNPLHVDVPASNKTSSHIFDNKDSSFVQCSQEAVDECIKNTTNETMTKKSCSQFLLESNRKSCLESFNMIEAMESGNIEKCDNTLDPDRCKYEFILMKWVESKNVEMCSDLDEDKKIQCNNYIIFYLAQQDLDIKICEKIILSYKWDDAMQFCQGEVTMLVEEQKTAQENAAKSMWEGEDENIDKKE